MAKKPNIENAPAQNVEALLNEASGPADLNYWPTENDGAGVSIGDEAQYYFAPEKDRTLWGILVGTEVLPIDRFDGEGKEDRVFFLMETTRPTYAALPRATTVDLVPEGTMLRVGMRTKLAPLLRLMFLPFTFEVGIRCLGTVDIGKRRKMHRFEFRANPIDRPRPQPDLLLGTGAACSPETAADIAGVRIDPQFAQAARTMTFAQFNAWRQGGQALPPPPAQAALGAGTGTGTEQKEAETETETETE